MFNKLFSHSLVYGLAPYIPYIFSVLILPLTTPYLTEMDFGIYGIVVSYLTFLTVFQYLGLHVNFNNSFYQYPTKYKFIWRQIFGFLNYWNVLFSIITGIIMYFIIPDAANENLILILLLNLIPTILFGPIDLMARSYYQLNKRPGPLVIRNIIFGIGTSALNLLFIKYMQLGYMGWFWSIAIIKSITGISFIYPLIIKERITPILNFSKRTIKKALKVSLPLVPHSNALILLSQSDRIVMDWLKIGPNQIGIYSAAYNLGSTVDTVGNGFNQAATPYIYELLNKGDEHKIRKIIFLSQIAFLGIALSFSTLAKEIMEFLIRNDELNKAYPLMVIIAMTLIFKPMYIASTIRFYFYEKTKSFAIHSLIAGLVNILLNILLLPYYGIEAAAITTFLGYMILSYSRFFLKDFKTLCPIQYFPFFWIIINIGVCISGYYLSQAPFSVRFFALFIVIIGSLSCMYIVNKKLSKIEK